MTMLSPVSASNKLEKVGTVMSQPDELEWLGRAAAERLDLVIAEYRTELAEIKSQNALLRAANAELNAKCIAYLANLDEKHSERMAEQDKEVKSAIAIMFDENIKMVQKIDQRLAAVKDGKDGRDGIDGKDGSQGLQGEKGDPGESGATGIPGPRGEAGPTGERGEPGIQGEKGDVGEPGPQGPIGDYGPPGEKGDPGLNGKDGAPGERGEKGDPGLDGKDGAAGLNGKDGLDGITPENAEMFLEDGGRHLGLKFGEKITLLKTAFPVQRLVWREGNIYEPGDQVTRSGSQWICEKETNTCPGTKEGQKAWTLIVKAGRDGRNGKDGERGPEGKEGRPGRDLTQMGPDGSKW